MRSVPPTPPRWRSTGRRGDVEHLLQRRVGRAAVRALGGDQQVADFLQVGELVDGTHQEALRALQAPPEMLMFSSFRRLMTVSIGRFSWASFCWSMSTWISSSRSPPTLTAATPVTGSSFFFSLHRHSGAGRSARGSHRHRWLARALDSTRRMIGSVDGLKRSSTGPPAAGSALPSCRAPPGWPGPCWCPRRTPLSHRSGRCADRLPACRFLPRHRASSTGWVIRVSISVGAAPVYSVRTVSVG